MVLFLSFNLLLRIWCLVSSKDLALSQHILVYFHFRLFNLIWPLLWWFSDLMILNHAMHDLQLIIQSFVSSSSCLSLLLCPSLVPSASCFITSFIIILFIITYIVSCTACYKSLQTLWIVTNCYKPYKNLMNIMTLIFSFLFFFLLLYLSLYFPILFSLVYLFIILSKGTSEWSTGAWSLYDPNTCYTWSMLHSWLFWSPVEPFITYRLSYLRFHCFMHCSLMYSLRGLQA